MLLAMVKARNAVSGGFLPTSEVADKFNVDLSPEEKISAKTIGRIIRSLGFKGDRTSSARGFEWDLERLAVLCDEYGVEKPTDLSQGSLF